MPRHGKLSRWLRFSGMAFIAMQASALAVRAQTAAPPAPVVRVNATIPDHLSDSEFWRLSSEYSEPSGYFRSENFVSNESAWQQVIPPMLKYVRQNGVYLGVGPEQNFTYVIAFKPKIAFIVDIRRQNLLQHLWYKAVSELSPDRAEFLSKLFARTKPTGVDSASSADALITAFEQAAPDSVLFRRTYDAVRDQLVTKHGFKLSAKDLEALYHVDSAFYDAGPALNYSFGQGGRGGRMGRGMPTFATLMRNDDGLGLNRSFIGSEANYRALRDMEQRNLIVPIVGNFAGDKALSSVAAYLKARKETVSVFYLSNVEQYLFMQGDEWSRFYTNVGRLPLDSASTFIRSATVGRGGGGSNGGYGGGYRGTGGFRGGLMTQLMASMQDLVQAFRDGKIMQYGDVLNLSH
jgi:hypothetical protein